MPALIRTDYTARITWLGRVPDRDASLRAEPVTETQASFAGFDGEAHAGETRPACSRFTMLYPKGTEVRNTRQLSILSEEELAGIAAAMGLDKVNPGWLGASMVVSGLPDFSHLTPGARLLSEAGTTITIDLENGPCHFPGKVIDEDAPGHGKAFKAAAEGRRGVTAWIERPGPVRVGDDFALFLPTQPAWSPA